ncbi:MAG TPA: Ig-like domain-containing protein [Planctomycetota bacterium]|nr:Ig-like domain-containing protein [Planctomycetota bacterium]
MTDSASRARPKFRPFAQLALAAAAAWSATACDNPACVFGPGGCSGTASGSTNAAQATVPANHQWIENASPTIVTRIPSASSTTLGVDSPVALVFSESMSSSSLATALRMDVAGSGGFGAPIQIATALVGDGRVLVILPLQPLDLATSYELSWLENAIPVDLQGQALAIPTNRVAGTFNVATTAPATVRLLGTFPADGAINQSGVGEFIALFDRKLNGATVTGTSFDVKVGGAEPAFDPVASALSVSAGGVSAPDTRVYRWRSVDAALEAVPLGPGLEFDASLSPVGSKIAAVDQSLLAPILVRYDIAQISPALSAEIVSMPTDAIGIDNVSGPETLDIAVTLASAQVGDRLAVFVFGNSLDATPKRVALFREMSLATTATTVHITEDELDLATNAGIGRLADGTINFAIRMQRGVVTTPVRLLDADLAVAGVQSPLIDTVRPTLTGLGPTGTSTTVFRSNLRDFALLGRASERIRAAEVTTALGDNGILTPVVGSTSAGLFVAAPVFVGNLTPAELPLPFTAVIYDAAFNAAAVQIAGDFFQVGASGPGSPLPGPSVTVEVFDSATFAPLPNALVMVHEDIGGGTVLPIDAQLTDAQGVVTLSGGFIGDTFVTVDLAGFDLFTFEDVPTDRLSVPLTRSNVLPSTVAGVVSSKSATFASFDRSAVDSRRFARAEPLIPVQSCTANPATGSDCPFGPALIRPNLVGVTSVFALEPPASELSYNAFSFLRAFQIAIPVASVGAAGVSSVTLVANSLLSDAGVGAEERAIDGPAPVLDLNSTSGILLPSLVGDPRILVEALVRGLPGSATVGLGVAFDQGGDIWNVHAAYPGAADGVQDTPQDELGRLVSNGTIDPDLRLSCEVRDNLGARAGRRPLFSQVGATLEPTSAPVILAPPPAGNTGGATFDLVISNAIPDSSGTPGIYVATIAVVPSGRRWTIWRPDLDDSSGPTRTIHVPDLAALGGVALPDGALTATVEAFGYASFTSDDFFWSDIEREYDAFSASAPSAFSQP